MIHFTPQESRILIFLVAALLLGSAISLYRRHRPHVASELSVSTSEVVSEPSVSDSTIEEEAKNTTGQKLNINTATSQELQTLPGIGPQLAERIIAHRQAHGYFLSVHHITEVRGIGEKTFQRIGDSITVE
jgi:comEA protein